MQRRRHPGTSASIKADLAAPRWELTPRGIKIEDKQEIRKRLGGSPDDGAMLSSCVLPKAPKRQCASSARSSARTDRSGPM
jgi:hypothetical protein